MTLIAHGEFSIVIASLGIALDDGAQLGVLAAAYVLMTAVVGPILAKNADALASAVARTKLGAKALEAAPISSD